jgi:hypothetical protein
MRGNETMADQQRKTRAEREKELRRLLNVPGGREKIYELLYKLLELPPGAMPPAGTPVIQTILDKEYPNG